MHQIVAPHAYGENGIPTHFEILNVSFDACYLPRDKRMLDFLFVKCVSLTNINSKQSVLADPKD